MKTIYNFLLSGLILMVLLSSCKVSKHYQRSVTDTQKLYRDTTVIDTMSLATIPWKEMFSDTILQGLIQEGITNNADLQVAVSRLQAAQANARQSKAALYPSLYANADVTLQKQGRQDYTRVYDAYLSSSWEVDVWGKLRSSKRAAVYAFKQSEAYQRAVQTQVVADIATLYYTLLALDAQLQITQQTISIRLKDVETMKLFKESNKVTGADVVQSEASHYSAAVTLPDIKQNIRETENSLSIMLGRNPGHINRSQLEVQQIHTDLKIGLPMQLLANRPDVQEAEFALAYHTELTNAARAYFYPALTITATGGFSNSDFSQLFNTSSLLSNIVGGLTQPIFANGLNKQRLAVAKATQQEYLSVFKQKLLTAGQEVSNALYDYQAASEKITIRAVQIGFLQKSVDYTRELLKYTSATNYTDVLTSEQNLLSAQLSGINDKEQQLNAVVKLYRSLGGGWK